MKHLKQRALYVSSLEVSVCLMHCIQSLQAHLIANEKSSRALVRKETMEHALLLPGVLPC